MISPGQQRLSVTQRLVPGHFPQVQKDLESYPEPVLDLLDRYGMRVAVLDDGQTLAQSPALRHLTEDEYSLERSKAQRLVLKAVTNSPQSERLEIAERATRDLRKAGLDFHLGLSRGPIDPTAVAEQQNISPEDRDDWAGNFKELNHGLPEGLVILPHVYDGGKPIAENALRSAKEVSAEYVERSLGLNRPEDRLVLLHQKFTPAQATEVGNYRLVLHEMAHALDHVLENLTSMPGFGAAHRATLDALYEADLKRAGNDPQAKVFTSDRADDDVREYFAEAVEAYLTPRGDGPGEIFRTDNCREELQARNAELFGYVEKVMKTDFSKTAAPPAPGRSFLPPGFPDPDTEVYQF